MMFLNKEKFNTSLYAPTLGVLGFFSIIFLAGYFLLFPLHRNILGQNETVGGKEISIQEREANLEKIIQLKKSFSDFPEKVDLLEEIKIAQSETEQIMAQIEIIAKEAGVSLNSFVPTQVTSTESGGTNIQVTGTYDNFRKFLFGIESNQLILNVDNVSVAGNDGETLVLSLSIKAGI